MSNKENSSVLSEDQPIAVDLHEQDLRIEVSSPDLEILYQDDFFVAVNKPSGLLVHRSWLDSHATEFALQKVRNQIGKYVFPVHRLDRPTSGVLLFALDKDSARNMMPQFAGQGIGKRYLAVVRGHLGDGELDYPLKEIIDKIADKKAQQDKPAQQAFTEYRCLAQTTLPIAVRPYDSSRYSLMEMTPKTGRKHQLRRHMAHLRHPIIGDTSHGDGKHNNMFRDNFANRRLLLHAAFLSFKHPESGQLTEINAPLDQTFNSLLCALNLNVNEKFDEIKR
ncbi:MAG: tRNA pseudouridine65 synthase [Psychromonas sp.]|jgi:tRNA pseudouridine65 synthase|uniref:tRNA pseudouridine(65) synthase TruC n=1 Tax=Psychromonas sp. TaxID=1884585 RepID=UPI0039E386E1